MNKWLKGLAIGTLALGLAACGGEENEKKPADANGEKQTEQKVEKKEEQKQALTLEEVFEKATEASKDIQSMKMDMASEQSTEILDTDMKMDNKMTAKLEMVQEPFAMHQELTMGMGEESMEMEIYIVEDGFYVNNPQMGQWMKLPEDQMGDLEAMLDLAKGAEVNLEELAEYQDQFELVEEKDHYVLKMSGSGDDVQKMIQGQVEASGILETMGEDVKEVMEQIEIHELSYEVTLDKETFHTNDYQMDMDFEMAVEDQKMRMKQTVKSTITDINKIDEIVLPKEVQEAAVVTE